LHLENNFDWRNRAVSAAEFRGPQGTLHLRCVGRHGRIGGRRRETLPQGQSLPRDLARWLAAARTSPEWNLMNSPQFVVNQVGAFEGSFFPRRHVVQRSDCPRRQRPQICHQQFVCFGESCAGKMHFDCLGFLCYVYTRTVGRPRRRGFPFWKTIGSEVSLAGVHPADIVYWSKSNPTHAAIVVRGGSDPRLIHANGDQRGVEMTPLPRPGLVPRDNIGARHIPERFFGSGP
jgi:hypothetical protein